MACHDLEDKKLKLFQASNFDDWGINAQRYCIDKKTLTNNKTIACHLMLPLQTAAVQRIGKVFGYFNYQLLNQTEHVLARRAKRYIRSFSEWSTMNMEMLQEVTILVLV